MKIRSIVTIAVALFAVASTNANAAERTQTVNYNYGYAGDVMMSCDGSQGGACFDLTRDDRVADITARDNSGAEVGVRYYFGKEAGSVYLVGDFGLLRYEGLGQGIFCGSARGLVIPEGATRLSLYLDGFVNGSQECGGAPGAPVYATAGTISIRFASE